MASKLNPQSITPKISPNNHSVSPDSPDIHSREAVATEPTRETLATSPANATTKSDSALQLNTPKSYKVDKKGRSTSCLLCQKRKQKCDRRLPSCTTCLRAGAECVQPIKYGVKAPAKDEYTRLLEKRIKYLEKLMDKHLPSTEVSSKKYTKLSPYIVENSVPSDIGNSTTNSGPAKSSSTDTSSLSTVLPVPTTFLHHSNPLTHRMLPNLADLDKKHDRLSLKHLDFNLENDYNNSFMFKYNLNEFLNAEPVYEIDESYSRQLLDIYFTRMQYKFPLLDVDEVVKLHESYFNSDLLKLIKDGDQFHISFAKLWLVFLILASLHMTTGRYSGPLPQRFFCTGLRHLTKCAHLDDLSKIEILTLIVVYLTRTDRDSIGVFDIIGDLISLCVNLNLHKAWAYRIPGEEAKLRDRKLRVFWSVYVFEKTILVLVSKRYILPESMCDPDLPLFDYEPSNRTHPVGGPMFVNQMIKIRRIELRFVEALNIISARSKVSKSQLPLVGKFFEELDEWRRSCETFAKGVENETLSMYYYRSVRVLIQPFLELLDPEDKLFRECQAALGQICQLFKLFHQKTVFGHSTTHVHTVFVAGVTLIYCLWLTRNKDDLRRKQLGDVSKHTRPIVSEELFSGLDDLRLCSICLYVMSERTKFALCFRDTFDELMNATIGNLILRCGPDSSEIIYSNEPGMPPLIVRKPIKHFAIDESLSHYKTAKTDEEKLEEQARREKQGQLHRSIPKSLSHLLIHSPPPEEVKSSVEDTQKLSTSRMNKAKSQGKEQVPHQSQSQSATVGNSEITPFNGRTTRMINNISTWTGESGQQINTGLLSFSLNELDDILLNDLNVGSSEEYLFSQ